MKNEWYWLHLEVVSIPTMEVFKYQERDTREGVPKTEKIELEDLQLPS